MSIFPYFQHFTGFFKVERYNSHRPPKELFRNNMSCKSFANFVRKSLRNRLTTGAISLLGKVGDVQAPDIVLPLTVEPSKPHLCHDARYLNLWMRDKPFSLDSLNDLPWYVAKDSYQTVLDDKSGYDQILLSDESRTFLGSSRVAGTLHITVCRLVGKSYLTFTIQRDYWLLTFFVPLVFHVCFISMIDTMDNFKFH